MSTKEPENISGAITGQPAPELPVVDTTERDSLFHFIEEMKKKGFSIEEIQVVEKQLDELLEKDNKT